MKKGGSRNRGDFSEGPWRITFDTNPDSCNLSCIMCEVHGEGGGDPVRTARVEGGIPRLMDPRIIRSVIRSAVPFGLREIIPSTMGEPLLYPWFNEILNLVSHHGLRINLTTNGTFPGRGAEGWGRVILPVASDVKISVNGSSPTVNESIMRGIRHREQLRNIQSLLAIRDEVGAGGENHPTITLQVTFMEKNLRDLPNLLTTAIQLGVDRFKGHQLWVTWPHLERESLRRSRESRIRWNDMAGKLHSIADNVPLPDGKHIKLDNVFTLPVDKRADATQENRICPFAGREAWIAWDGTFNVCCCPDEVRRGFGHFGNVTERDFMELWGGQQYLRFVGGWGSYEACRECNMRRPPPSGVSTREGKHDLYPEDHWRQHGTQL